MPVSLAEILETTGRSLDDLRRRRPELEARAAKAPAAPSFQAALRGARVGVIAEVKRQSPSRGVIRGDLEPVEQARAYAAAGAAAISVLTDGPFFGGSIGDLERVAAAVRVPVLRKDFILDESQIVEARAAGAAAVLLIVRALSVERLRALLAAAGAAGLETLVEVHTDEELDVAVNAGAPVIGVNSRDLDTFRVDVKRGWRLLGQVPPDRVAVAESGMASVADVEQAAAAGADAVLIGTALSAAPDPTSAVQALAGVRRNGR
ncbi:MAG TPA: indole-3-glycerol phosphate synthase TrpC [Gemmatimonadales bacterium]|nr:indole-3-glycerol phosphate synthase TrpC [Gemmatimonadales bacterium]